jgi:hypothetical protein
MKNAYEQIVENMQTRTCTHLNDIPLWMAALFTKAGPAFRETVSILWNITAQDPGYNRFF